MKRVEVDKKMKANSKMNKEIVKYSHLFISYSVYLYVMKTFFFSNKGIFIPTSWKNT